MFVSCINKDTKQTTPKAIISSNTNNKQTPDKVKKNDLKVINDLYKYKSLNHRIIETNQWLEGVNTIFVFENRDTGDNLGKNVDGFVYIFKDHNYQKIKIDTYEPEGVQVNIETFFFYNVDRDNDKELIVLCSWVQRYQDIEGKLFQVYVYDNYIEDA